MAITLIHLSDLHFRKNWAEQHGTLLDALFIDLKTQSQRFGSGTVYLVFSGDIAFAGEDDDIYREAFDALDRRLTEINIPREFRMCVPGNHDVSRKVLRETRVEHDGVLAQGLRESDFNDYALSTPNRLSGKFGNYVAFQERFAAFGVKGEANAGTGWLLKDNVGVFCLNTALCSFAGTPAIDGTERSDRGKLAVETRTLQKWLQSCTASTKILVMHHPLYFMTDWATRELGITLQKHFALCLIGHTHCQSVFHTVHRNNHLVECVAPPLFTTKQECLGYAMVSVEPGRGVQKISYRQWTPRQVFVSGVSFSDSDDGTVHIASADCATRTDAASTSDLFDRVNRLLAKRFEQALVSYQSQPRIWIEPTLRGQAETESGAASSTHVTVAELVAAPGSTIVHAPPQFGLSCLARYLAKQAWLADPSRLWIYLDAREAKPHASSIEKLIGLELSELGCDRSAIACILLDSWSAVDRDSLRVVKKLCEMFPTLPVLVFHTFDRIHITTPNEDDNPTRTFSNLYLWSLNRNGIREVVSHYNEVRRVGEEDAVTSRVIKDLAALNLYRTPLNCLTLLKVSEVDFDESPVNRTEMIKRVLFLLFNLDAMPNYKTRPDLDDCEYVLGYFCETLLRRGRYEFTRDEFLGTTRQFCEERFIDLDVEIVFDILFVNHIIIRRGDQHEFRFAYWLFYFGAHRMHQNDAFAKYILDDMAYINFPEIIEFYTGIDRRREDAVRVLLRDIRAASSSVRTKCGLPDTVNPLGLAKWKPSDALLKNMEKEIAEGVRESNLPTAVKDRYADRDYDRRRPYHQDIQTIVRECSLPTMMQTLKAASRALRNSDYVDPELKAELLTEIATSWEELSRVLLVITPLLVEQGRAAFDGAGFFLHGDFGDKPQERFWRILSEVPWNIVAWYEDDLFSHRMGPLLLHKLSHEAIGIRRHLLVLLVIRQRPRGWKSQVQNYIVGCDRNSFYLYDVYRSLRGEYRYSYASPRTLQDFEYLIKLVAGKHFYHLKSTGTEKIGKVPDSVLPERDVKDK